MDAPEKTREASAGRRFQVIPGLHQPLDQIPDHQGVSGIDRFLLLTQGAVPGRSFHLAVHVVSTDYEPEDGWKFSHPHSHDFDELNVLIPSSESFRYRYEVDGEVQEVEGPCSTFIPAGTSHRMEPIEGTGYFLCIQLGPEAGEPQT